MRFKRVRDSADIHSESDVVTKAIIDVEEQVRKTDAAVEQAAHARDAVRATLREVAKKLTRLDLSEQERAALVAEQQSCVADLTAAAEDDLMRLSRKEELLRKDKEQLRKDKEQLREEEDYLRKEELQQAG
ncbi:hypothetical protein HXX76_011667 [Chlamydomonas incerta]|uniref:Uncharacterized protein n=1 Tax=Chlamydomonas incerta TaxID=51695 RepID=A0A835SG91_CHLIN|nr:hypothetical protein HXX76_011667 [Chlamydomonas incerta]|eukprot:KAG2422853.1 hypothetical protein HXX76_011667 [Chlamydomonas incerta]